MKLETGTIADTIDPEKFKFPDYMTFDPNDEEFTHDLFEAYDNSNRRFQEAKDPGEAAIAVYKYFLDTYEDQGRRSYEDFKASPYYKPEFTSKIFSDRVFHTKKLTKDEILGRLGRLGNRGDYSSPVTNGFGQRIDKSELPTEEFDDTASEEDTKDLAFLKQVRKSLDNFESKELTLQEIVNEKYDKIYETAERVASGRSLKRHAFIYGAPGIGKSHTVEKAVRNGLAKWAGVGKKPTAVFNSGVIGSSLTPLVIFFFRNSKNKIIVLDDADGFVTKDSEDIQNFCKALLDPVEKAVTIPPTIRKGANKLYQDELAQQAESKIISVDTSKLNENILTVKVGKKIIESKVEDYEKPILSKYFPMHKTTYEEKKLFESVNNNKHKAGMKYNAFGKLVTMRENDIVSSFNIEDIKDDPYKASIADDLGDELDVLPEEIPAKFYFTSSLILISNLDQEDLNDAVKSRCDCRGIYLTPDEFMCRCESILDDLEVSKSTLTSRELVQWAKRESFAFLKAAMTDMKYANSKLHMVIGIPLEFRLISTLAGLLLARYDRWHEANHMQGDGNDVLKKFEQDQAAYYLKFDLLPVMAGDKSMG